MIFNHACFYILQHYVLLFSDIKLSTIKGVIKREQIEKVIEHNKHT